MLILCFRKFCVIVRQAQVVVFSVNNFELFMFVGPNELYA